MEDLKKGDVITFSGLREEVLARLEDLIWTRSLFANGSVGSVQSAILLEDLIVYGWKKENK